MSARNSTPGPWFVGTMNDALFILDKQPRPAPIDFINPNAGKDTRVIAKLAENDRRADADAALLAAAPDLYAALKQAVEYARLECVAEGMPPGSTPSRLTIQDAEVGDVVVFDLKAAAEALAKAEGRS